VEKDVWIEKISDEIKKVIDGVTVKLEVFPAGTDGRHIRHAGVPCIGFSPIRNTPVLLHDNDEYVTETGFLEGIEVYAAIIKRLSSS
jgi:aminoacylase